MQWGMQEDVVLPAFELDCREWLISTPDDAGFPDELAGAPLLAVLSSAVFDRDAFRSVSAVLTVGLLDDDLPPALAAQAGSVAAELVDDEDGFGSVRYVAPVPGGHLALVAEFTVEGDPDAEVMSRIEALMASFRWAA